jgi:membrane associated rhomboid family serine protease
VESPVRERYRSQAEGLRTLAVLVAIMWVVEFVNVLDSYRLDHDGIVPRSFSHLDGIVFAPFLHASFGHLLSNTVPFVILGVAIALAGARRLLLVSGIVALVSGLGTWLIAPGGTVTVGASGVVFGYATYLISRGVFDRRIVEIALGVLVGVFFGAALIYDLIPKSGISWQAHLFGGIGGVIAAAALARPKRPAARGRRHEPAGVPALRSPRTPATRDPPPQFLRSPLSKGACPRASRHLAVCRPRTWFHEQAHGGEEPDEDAPHRTG